MFRSTHTANAVSSATPIFLRKSPSNRNNDSLGNRNCPAISFTVLPVARLRSKIDSSAVKRAPHPIPAGFVPSPLPTELPTQCGFAALMLFIAVLTSGVLSCSRVGIVLLWFPKSYLR
jgi:hypothetical protein